MKVHEYPLLADENIAPEVVNELAGQGRDIVSVHGEGLAGADDLTLLRFAHQSGRVVLTHDSDFGTLALQQAEPYIGFVFLRPGDIQSHVVLGMIEAVDSLTVNVEAPFIIVAALKDEVVRVRVRTGFEDKIP